MNSYVRFANVNGIDLVQLKTGKTKKGIYNIQHINSYHSQLCVILMVFLPNMISLILFSLPLFISLPLPFCSFDQVVRFYEQALVSLGLKMSCT
jgi:hypothetical protein